MSHLLILFYLRKANCCLMHHPFSQKAFIEEEQESHKERKKMANKDKLQCYHIKHLLSL